MMLVLDLDVSVSVPYLVPAGDLFVVNISVRHIDEVLGRGVSSFSGSSLGVAWIVGVGVDGSAIHFTRRLNVCGNSRCAARISAPTSSGLSSFRLCIFPESF